MMFGNRIELALQLRLAGDLHIGAGIDEKDPKLRDKDAREEDDDPFVALVQRDVAGNAVIPATSLKGALRSQAPLTEEQFNRLLGEQGEVEPDEHGDIRRIRGRIGRLWLGCAIAEPMDASQFAGATKNGGVRNQGFVKTAVRIARKSGAAEDKLLYNREMIGSGVKFTAKAMLFIDGADETELVDLLTSLLAPLARDPGLAIGAHQRQAGGRLRLDEITVERRAIDAATLDLGKKREARRGQEVLAAAGKIERGEHKAIRLTLTCDGPFISMRDKVKVPDRDGVPREETQPLTQPDEKPRLWPSSLLGAMRARAAWLVEIERLRANGKQAVDSVADNRDKVVLRKDEAAALSPVQRLFGVAGWRGLLRVASLKPTAGCHLITQRMTSVTIDRFTGGGIDERLFNERVFLNAAFTCDLQLDERRGVAPAERALLDVLLADIQTQGLELGHGGSKGFGWFDVKVEQGAYA